MLRQMAQTEINRAVAQGLARSVRDREVGGSNPLSPIKWLYPYKGCSHFLLGKRVDLNLGPSIPPVRRNTESRGAMRSMGPAIKSTQP